MWVSWKWVTVSSVSLQSEELCGDEGGEERPTLHRDGPGWDQTAEMCENLICLTLKCLGILLLSSLFVLLFVPSWYLVFPYLSLNRSWLLHFLLSFLILLVSLLFILSLSPTASHLLFTECSPERHSGHFSCTVAAEDTHLWNQFFNILSSKAVSLFLLFFSVLHSFPFFPLPFSFFFRYLFAFVVFF